MNRRKLSAILMLFVDLTTNAQWEQLSPTGSFMTVLAMDPVVIAGKENGAVIMSFDGGDTWEPRGSGLPGSPVSNFACGARGWVLDEHLFGVRPGPRPL